MSSHNGQHEVLMCTNNCGFFGGLHTERMCSKCYNQMTAALVMKDKLKLKETHEQLDHTVSSLVKAFSELQAPSTDHVAEVKPLQKAARGFRCRTCNKRLGWTAIKCRCGPTFCSLHISSAEHGCTYNYKEQGRKAIAEANPKVARSKLEKL